MREEILRMEHIFSADGERIILNYLSMQIYKREIYGVLCLEKQGIDKMVDLICWNHPIQNGRVYFDEELVNMPGNEKHTRNQVLVIGRSRRLIEGLTIEDNLFVIREGFKKNIVPERAIRNETRRILEEFDIPLSPGILVHDIGNYYRLAIEMLTAIIERKKIIILWEISDLLSTEELLKFHRLLRKIAEKGITFIYIYSHHETLAPICNRIAIFKENTIQKVLVVREGFEEQIHRVFARYAYEKIHKLCLTKKEKRYSSQIMRADHLSSNQIIDFNLSIVRAENTLIVDKSNTVLDELADIMRGTTKPRTGSIIFPKEWENDRTRLAFIQREPLQTMLFPELSYIENLCFLLAEKIPYFWQKPKLKKSVLKEFEKEIGEVIEADNLYGLSQKKLYELLYYRYLIARPDLIICMQPLSDMDMYLRGYVLELMMRLRKSGIALVVLNTEISDTLYIADKLLLIEKGMVTNEYKIESLDDIHRIQSIMLQGYEEYSL